METIIRRATMEDLKYIDSLAKSESKSIGFLPKVVYESAITGLKPSPHRWSQTCNDTLHIAEENGDPVGFVLAGYGRIATVHQVCIQNDARLMERGRLLLSAVIDRANARGVHDFKCGCADDLESNIFWKAMGWKKVAARGGIFYADRQRRKRSDRLVNVYRFATSELGLLTGVA